MTPLRQRLIEDLTLRNDSPQTIRRSVDNVARLARYHGKSPGRLDRDDMRRSLLSLVEERKLAVGSYQQALAALRHFCRWVLKRGDIVKDMLSPPSGRRLPVVLSPAEVGR